MANEEFKTTVISYDERKPEVAPVEQKQQVEQPKVQNVLFNITTKVPHVAETLPTVKVESQEQKKIDLSPLEKANKNYSALPKFYLREYKRSARLAIMWAVITAICAGLETWALVEILRSPVNNWIALTLIPAITLCIAMLVIYINNWINFKNEARTVDFTQGKIPTINVMKLYKRLKTAHINVNWFCCLTYVVGGLAILITYIVGWAIAVNYFMKNGNPDHLPVWGVLDPNYLPYKEPGSCGASILISVIVCSASMLTAFILHVVLLVTNYVRAGKIDSFYAVQIVSDEELNALKKKKNKRDLFIFLGVVMVVALIGLLIYKAVKSKRVSNQVTINNGPTATIPTV